MIPLAPDYEVLGVPMDKIARLARRVVARANNDWRAEKVSKSRLDRHRCQVDIAGIRIHIVEHGALLSIRGDGWALSFEHTGWDRLPAASRAFSMPSATGVSLVDGAKTYPAKYIGYEISSAGKFKHDMSILLMFESEW